MVQFGEVPSSVREQVCLPRALSGGVLGARGTRAPRPEGAEVEPTGC